MKQERKRRVSKFPREVRRELAKRIYEEIGLLGIPYALVFKSVYEGKWDDHLLTKEIMSRESWKV